MLISPTNDFLVILEENGQKIILRKMVRTIDTDGNVTNITPVDVPTKAIVDEFKKISLDVQMVDRVQIGDVKFLIKPNLDIKNLDKIIWNSNNYVIKYIRDPVKISNNFCYVVIETARENLSGV